MVFLNHEIINLMITNQYANQIQFQNAILLHYHQ